MLYRLGGRRGGGEVIGRLGRERRTRLSANTAGGEEARLACWGLPAADVEARRCMFRVPVVAYIVWL